MLSIDDLYIFNSEKWANAALTHSSLQGGELFERLEFLGDRVIGSVIADWVFERHPEATEGELSKRVSILVSRKQCAKLADLIGMKKKLQCAKRVDLERSSVLGNALEAWVGAVYKDGGYEQVRGAILKIWRLIDEPVDVSDYKSKLQEWLQSHHHNLPQYQTISTEGPEHSSVYYVKVAAGPCGVAEGKGHSRKKAEQDAAHNLLRQCGIIE